MSKINTAILFVFILSLCIVLGFHSNLYEPMSANLSSDFPYAMNGGVTYMLDNDLNTKALPPSMIQETKRFNEPGTYTYDAPTFIPAPNDGIFRYSSTGGSQIGIIKTTPYNRNDICQVYQYDKFGLENACKKLDSGSCNNTNCCVLLGGEKCVSGIEQGPILRNHYSDVLIARKDFYHYQGSCYGNCSA